MPEWQQMGRAFFLPIGKLANVEVTFCRMTGYFVRCGQIHLPATYHTLDEAKDAGVVLAARLLAEAQHALNLYRMAHGPDYRLHTTELQNQKGKHEEAKDANQAKS